MKALITGASSGIGRDIARELSARGCGLILTARRTDRLEELKNQLGTKAAVIGADLSKEEDCFRLHEQVAGEGIDILVNDAGFGVFGAFSKSDLNRELDMIDVNVRALHTLMKLFLKDFVERDSGYILNVTSSAAFQPGPLLAGYYASKAYVLRLTEAVAEELRRAGSGVYVGALCPGPVNTEFDSVADVRFSVKGLSSESVARYAVESMFRKKTVIVPGKLMKLTRFAERLLPERAVVRAAYHMQHRRTGEPRTK